MNMLLKKGNTHCLMIQFMEVVLMEVALTGMELMDTTWMIHCYVS